MLLLPSLLWGTIVCSVIMVDSAFNLQHNQRLVPSQVLLRRHTTKPTLAKKPHVVSDLTPSQVIIFSAAFNKETESPIILPKTTTLTSSTVAPAQNVSSGSRRKRPNHRRNNQTKPDVLMAANETNRSSKVGPSNVSGKRNQQTGKIPNIYWGAIPMDDLRQHPLFVPLPLPSEICKIDCLEDVRNFRQDSWQWDALHNGRCTTSQLASALGFLNPKSADVLGIPRSMRSATAGLSSFYRLSQQPLLSLAEMNDILCNATERSTAQRHSSLMEHESLWDVSTKPNESLPFYARYVRNSPISADKRQLLGRLVGTGALNGGSVRMMWGNTQESTAILTALNYFSRKVPGVVIKEVGMCGAGLDLNTTKASENQKRTLLIGASPDALLYYPDGSVEVVEVKNHCPFVSTSPPWARNVKANQDAFGIRFMPLNDARARSVPPQYLPQLMMEMLCVGPECTSAVMVRQTANNGAIILRLHRNDEWIDEMLHWLNRFHSDFVQPQVPPSTNFFWSNAVNQGDDDDERYMKFLKWTKDLCAAVDVVDHVPNKCVQRAAATSKSMFLD